ncbi:MAG: sulfite exporter TauE/SafE family protein [Bacillota bacterium]
MKSLQQHAGTPILNHMSISTYLYVAVTVFVGSVLQANMGLGVAILNMVVFPLLFDFSTAVALSVIIANATILCLIGRYWREVQWKTLAPMAIVSVLVSIATTLYSLNLGQREMKIILGVAFLLLSIYFLVGVDRVCIRPTLKNGLLIGVAAGVGNGLFGVGGPPAALYLMASLQEIRSYIATIQTYFLISNIFTLTVRSMTGAVHIAHLPLIAVGWGCAVAGTLLGVRLSGRLPERLTKRLVYAMIGVSGLATIIQAALGGS